MTTWVIGADEVGRGCLAGPLCVGAVMVPADMPPVEGVGDSKKLSPKKREEVAHRLRSNPKVALTRAYVHAADIDKDGISQCLRRAFECAIQYLLSLGESVEAIKIDGNPQDLTFGDVPVEFIVRGDDSDWRIGAASIIAKVGRDALMVKHAEAHPGYGWERNMGYGSPEHQEAIRVHGLTPHHRATFCRRFVQDDAVNVLDLFT